LEPLPIHAVRGSAAREVLQSFHQLLFSGWRCGHGTSQDSAAVYRRIPSKDDGIPCPTVYALNNRTLFNVAYNGVKKVRVLIVDPPSDWNVRFTGAHCGYCIELKAHLEAVVIPLSSLCSNEPRGRCFVVLEARNLIKPQRSDDSLLLLLQDFAADIKIEEVQGARSYARIRVYCRDADLAKKIIKAIGEQRGKTVEVREVPNERRYASPPRD